MAVPAGVRHINPWNDAAEPLGLQPGEVAMVGDDPEADVVGAMDAGLGGVFVGPAEAWGVRGRRPAARLGGVGELPQLL